MPATKKSVKKSTKTFPSISEGYQKAWDILGKTWLKQLILGVCSGAVSFVYSAFLFILFFLLHSKSIMSIVEMIKNQEMNMNALNPGFLVSIIAIPTVWILGLIIISMVFTVAIMKLVNVAYEGKELTIGELVKSSFPRLVPFILVGSLTSLLVFGGMMLFIVPGIVISIFLSFSSWEVVVENKKVIAALKESYRVVRANFWAILGRVLLLVGLIFVVNSVTNMFANLGGRNGEVSFIGSIVGTVFQVAAQYFAVAYGVVIYKQAKNAASNTPVRSLKGMVILSVVGWVLGIFFWASVMSFAMNAMKEIYENAQLQQAYDETKYEQMFQNTEKENLDVMPSINGKTVTPSTTSAPLNSGR